MWAKKSQLQFAGELFRCSRAHAKGELSCGFLGLFVDFSEGGEKVTSHLFKEIEGDAIFKDPRLLLLLQTPALFGVLPSFLRWYFVVSVSDSECKLILKCCNTSDCCNITYISNRTEVFKQRNYFRFLEKMCFYPLFFVKKRQFHRRFHIHT